jgi:hypothetical protein
MGMDSKKLALVIAGGMPPPNRLRPGGSMKFGEDGGGDDPGSDDATESPQEDQDESESGETGGGKAALKAAFDAMKTGDMSAAWDSFCDAIDIAKNRSKPSGNEKGGPY